MPREVLKMSLKRMQELLQNIDSNGRDGLEAAYQEHLTNDYATVKLSRPMFEIAYRTYLKLEIAGWKLLEKPNFSESKAIQGEARRLDERSTKFQLMLGYWCPAWNPVVGI
jgi:hypothetical protein